MMMIDNLGLAFSIFTAVAASTATYFFSRIYFSRKIMLLEAQIQQKSQMELQLLQLNQKIQVEKEQMLMRSTKAETKLVMANLVIADLKESALTP